MKIERQSKTFTPITITIESQLELDALLIGMHHSYATLGTFAERTFDIEHNLDDLDEAKNDFWFKLSNLSEA